MEDEPFGIPSELHDLEYVEDKIEYGLNVWFAFSIIYALLHSCLMDSSRAYAGLFSMLISMLCIMRYRQYQDLMKLARERQATNQGEKTD